MKYVSVYKQTLDTNILYYFSELYWGWLNCFWQFKHHQTFGKQYNTLERGLWFTVWTPWISSLKRDKIFASAFNFHNTCRAKEEMHLTYTVSWGIIGTPDSTEPQIYNEENVWEWQQCCPIGLAGDMQGYGSRVHFKLIWFHVGEVSSQLQLNIIDRIMEKHLKQNFNFVEVMPSSESSSGLSWARRARRYCDCWKWEIVSM